MSAAVRTLTTLAICIAASLFAHYVLGVSLEGAAMGLPLSVALIALHRSYLKDPAHD